MAIVRQKGSIYSSAPDFFYFASVGFAGDDVSLTYAVASDGSFTDYDLLKQLYDESGSPIGSPTSLGVYAFPPKDTVHNTSFDFQYGGGALSNTLQEVDFTAPVGNAIANRAESIKFQNYDNSGDKVGALKTLRFNGSATIRYLTRYNIGAETEFGKAFAVGYSTYNVATNLAQISFERFTDSGKALGGGVLRTFQEGENNQIRFGSYYTAANPNNGGTPSYILLNVGPAGTHEMQVETFSSDMSAVLQTATFTDAGPGQRPSTSLDSFGYLRPGSGTNTNFTVFSQTFEYKDASNRTRFEVEFEKVDPNTLALRGANEFAVDDNTGVAMQHLDNGNILMLYKLANGQSYLREFNTSLRQVGAVYAIPKDNYGFDSLAALGNNQFEVFWRQQVTSGANTGKLIQHHAYFDAGATITAAVNPHHT